MKISTVCVYLSFFGLLASFPAAAHETALIDSIQVENVQGKQVITHKVDPKDTYYSLGRKYQVNQKEISRYNNNIRLKIGDLIKIPTQRPFQAPPTETPAQAAHSSQNFTEYKVGKGETLYTIAKRFQVRVEDIIRFNELSGDNIQPDQILRIPQEPLPALASAPQNEQVQALVDEQTDEEPIPTPSNRFGITQVSDKGVGVWMEDLNTADGKMLALHKTAPVGTIIKITNPMTQRTTYAKVVGKYNDNNDTREAIVVISKATANLLGIIDKRFLINISYGVAK